MPWGIPTGNLLGRLPQTARPSVIALSFWLTSLLFSELLLRMFGTRAAPLYSLVLLLVMLGSAWLGYVPGVLICILTVVVAPRILLPSRPRHFDPVNLGLVLVVMLLISAVAASKRRAALALEHRVAQRTAELSQKQELLSEQAQLLNLATDAIFASDQNGVIRY